MTFESHGTSGVQIMVKKIVKPTPLLYIALQHIEHHRAFLFEIIIFILYLYRPCSIAMFNRRRESAF